MLCIYNDNINPYFNLAAEEYILHNLCNDDIFMLWRNSPSIIVGKYQNTLAEINTEFVTKNNIAVVRRLTGGGAVFHDLGNLNFTFIKKNENENFDVFTQPIVEVLAALGICARFEGRNDLTIDGKKISGNAQCIHGGRIMHHGTLLFSAQMNNLSDALKANPMKFTDKAVKSVRSRVTNISQYLQRPITIEQFEKLIFEHIAKTRANCRFYNFSEKDICAIQALANGKYSTWAWNYGNSPKYTFSKKLHTTAGNIELLLDVNNGEIVNCKFYGDFFSKKNIAEFEKMFVAKSHQMAKIAEMLANVNVSDYICGVKNDEILNLMF